MITLRNILVATDFSRASEMAVRYAISMALEHGSTLHLLHVLGDVASEVALPYGTAAGPLQHELERDARRRLEKLLTAAERRKLHAKITVFTSASPGTAILMYAKDEPIDLIVVGTEGRRGIAHLVMGSVAEHVVRLADCPVLTVRSPAPEPRAVNATAPMASTIL